MCKKVSKIPFEELTCMRFSSFRRGGRSLPMDRGSGDLNICHSRRISHSVQRLHEREAIQVCMCSFTHNITV